MHSLVSTQLTVGSTGLLQLWLYHCTLCSWWSHTITLPIFFWGENTTLYWGFLQETDANNLIEMKWKLSATARDKWQIRVSGATEVKGMNIAVWVAASWGSGHAHPAVICDHEWAPVHKLRQSVHASLIIHNKYSYAPHVVSGLICFRERHPGFLPGWTITMQYLWYNPCHLLSNNLFFDKNFLHFIQNVYGLLPIFMHCHFSHKSMRSKPWVNTIFKVYLF